jgi:histidinol dehydrogenase
MYDELLQVEKIFGPGNQYVTAAKMILQVSMFIFYI